LCRYDEEENMANVELQAEPASVGRSVQANAAAVRIQRAFRSARRLAAGRVARAALLAELTAAAARIRRAKGFTTANCPVPRCRELKEAVKKEPAEANMKLAEDEEHAKRAFHLRDLAPLADPAATSRSPGDRSAVTPSVPAAMGAGASRPRPGRKSKNAPTPGRRRCTVKDCNSPGFVISDSEEDEVKGEEEEEEDDGDDDE
jgi:hypothetical protein